MKGYLTPPEIDLEKTDELPVLSEDAILEFERANARKASRAGSLEDAIESLLTALEDADRRWRSLESKLEIQNHAITELQRRLGTNDATEPVAIAPTIATSRAAAPRGADSALPQDTAAPRLGPPEPGEPPEPDAPVETASVERRERVLLDRIASLESYIAERGQRWQQMDNELSSNTSRISELEAQLAARIARPESPGSPEQREPAGTETPPPPATLVCLSSVQGERYRLDKPVLTLGHTPDCDVRIASGFFTGGRATIRRDDSGAFIENTSRSNAVYVNGEKVERRRLMPGDEISLGAARFRFLVGAKPQ